MTHDPSEPGDRSPALMRRDYALGALDESDAAADPISQFARWFADAQAAGVAEPNVMTVATADLSGRPSARIVLLKGFDQRGFVFFTSYLGRKAADLQGNPRAALVFFWEALERQVRIEGSVERTSRQETQDYFELRPRPAQLGAWASRQSQPVESRAVLEKADAEAAARFAGRPIPAPDFWGGYRVVPWSVEFWQGRPSRLHDRLVYTRAGEAWTIQRLSP